MAASVIPAGFATVLLHSLIAPIVRPLGSYESIKDEPMPEWTTIGHFLIGIGIVIILLGGMLVAADRIPGLGQAFSWFGKLPGDVSFKRDNVGFYVPFGTSLLVSVLLTLLLWVLGWFFRR